MTEFDVLAAREEELTHEWTWLVEALHQVAEAAENGETTRAIRVLHDQAMAVGQRRNELRLEMARLVQR